jgi:hypothetical protein
LPCTHRVSGIYLRDNLNKFQQWYGKGHELGHFKDNVEVLRRARIAGEQAERKPYSNESDCKAKGKFWKDYYTAQIGIKAGARDNQFSRALCGG